MGKPYNHSYYFAGQGCTCGTMVCESCGQPIFNHANDWMAYKKTKDGDWGYACFHRKCTKDQSPWEVMERRQEEYAEKMLRLNQAIQKICVDFGMTWDDLARHIVEDD